MFSSIMLAASLALSCYWFCLLMQLVFKEKNIDALLAVTFLAVGLWSVMLWSKNTVIEVLTKLFLT